MLARPVERVLARPVVRVLASLAERVLALTAAGYSSEAFAVTQVLSGQALEKELE